MSQRMELGAEGEGVPFICQEMRHNRASTVRPASSSSIMS